MNQKPLFLAVALAALLVIGGAFCFISRRPVAVNQPAVIDPVVETPTQTEPENPVDTSDWNTYRNEEFGFEVKYPAQWEIKEKAGDNGDFSVVSLVSPETRALIEKRLVSETCDLSVYFYDSITSEPENRDKATTIEEMIGQNELVTRIGSTTLGGVDATDIIWGGNGAYYTILTVHNNHLYKVLSCHKATREQLSSTEKQIIKSFGFIEVNQN